MRGEAVTEFMEYLSGPDFIVGVLASGEIAYAQNTQPTEDVHVTVKVSVAKIISEAYLDLENVYKEIDEKGLPTVTTTQDGCFAGVVAGKWTARKLGTLTLKSGNTTVTYDGVNNRSFTLDSLKNPNSLTLKIGSTTVVYDGSSAKTFEIPDGSGVSY